MSQINFQKGFWWYFIRVILSTIAFIVAILLLSDWNYGINKTIGWAWDLTNIRFWIGVLLYMTLLFAFFSIITILIMKIAKLTK